MTPAPRILGFVGLVALLALGTGAIEAPADQRRGAPAPAPEAGAPVRWDSIAAAAGLEFRHVNGASPERHLPETMSGGGLFFDYDADGWVDILLVDGGSIADTRVDATARHRLYRNRGDGTFEDATAGSGIAHGQYGMGACAAD